MFCRSSLLLFKFSHQWENVLPIVKRCCDPGFKTIPTGQRTYHVWNSYDKRKLFDFGLKSNINPKYVRYKNRHLQNQQLKTKNTQSPNENNVKFRSLWSPLGFTLLVGGGSFACAAICYGEKRLNPYGRLNTFVKVVKHDMTKIPILGEFLSTNISTGRKVIAGIVLTNIMVFACWKMKFLYSTMTKYYLNSAEKSTKISSMLFSTFSHQSFLHLFVNMYVLWSFSAPLAALYCPEELTAVYITSGVVASFAAMTHKIIIKSPMPSLGASGAILAMIGIIACHYPQQRVQIALIGEIFPHSFSIDTGIKGIIALDVLGLLLGWKLFDHAAHLGGMLFGLWFAKYGHTFLFKTNGYAEKVFRTWIYIKNKLK